MKVHVADDEIVSPSNASMVASLASSSKGKSTSVRVMDLPYAMLIGGEHHDAVAVLLGLIVWLR
jgi:hypothetical protein